MSKYKYNFLLMMISSFSAKKNICLLFFFVFFVIADVLALEMSTDDVEGQLNTQVLSSDGVNDAVDSDADELYKVKNLLRNDEFELSSKIGEPDEWENYLKDWDDKITERQIEPHGYNGKCVRISRSKGNDFGIKQAVGKLVPGKQYTLSVWCKGSPQSDIVIMTIQNASWTFPKWGWSGGGQQFKLTENWQE